METRDGTMIAIDWFEGTPTKDCVKPILVMLPGLAGSNQSAYIKNMIRLVNSEFKCAYVW
jgi:predicted alpha/beta-fold hydrolase